MTVWIHGLFSGFDTITSYIGKAGLRCDYDVVTSLALGGGMHYPSVSSFSLFIFWFSCTRLSWPAFHPLLSARYNSLSYRIV